MAVLFEPVVRNRITGRLLDCSNEQGGVDKIRLSVIGKTDDEEADSAVPFHEFQMLDLVGVDHLQRQPRLVFGFFRLEIDIFAFIKTVVVRRRRGPVVRLDDLRAIAARVVDADHLDRGRFFINQRDVQILVVRVGRVDVFFEGRAALGMIVDVFSQSGKAGFRLGS